MKKIVTLLLGFLWSATALSQTVEVVATNLNVPWAIVFAPDGRIFINERPGQVRVIDQAGVLQDAPVIDLANPANIPDGQAVRSSTSVEGGLLGIAVDPNFADNRYIYVYYTFGTTFPVNLRNRVARLVEDGAGSAVYDATILNEIPGGNIHDGGRIKIGPDGKLWIAVGSSVCTHPQDLNFLDGKILRINLDGSPPDDNPFPGPAPTGLIYSYGHRNPEGLAWDANGQLYNTEHGPTGDCGYAGSSYDEVNIIYAGANYGWPICRGICMDPRFVDPVRLFFPETAAPSGAAFYSGSMYFGTLGFPGNTFARHVHQLTFDAVDPTLIVDEQILFRPTYGRIREVVAGPDGFLYFTNSNRDGRGSDVLQPDDDKIFRVAF